MISPENPDIVYQLSGDTADDLSGFDKESGSMQNIMSFSNINAQLMIFAMHQYPTWFFLVLFTGLNLVIDQNNVISQPYQSLNQATNGQIGSKAIKTLHPNKYMLAQKLFTDDSFMRGFNSSKIGSRTKIQVIIYGNLTKGIIDTANINPSQNKNDFKQFIGTRAYSDPTKASITPMMPYLCDAFVRIIFDDSSMPLVLNIDVIGELAGGAIKSQ
ncbi:MAG: hypothetical protein EZS28_042219 [Streblomastix strix]|uniref:Uncharacterized protein n=1 Tax=Streblomastix strix TaxID=222440 RepID=A0A5J4TVF2_9EUKA|nr:MAG: hypothetical protein EZS28_042219 [Streblomastix strix]